MPTLVENDKNNKSMEPKYIVLGDPRIYLNSHKLIWLANLLDRERHTHTHKNENHGLNFSIIRLIHY